MSDLIDRKNTIDAMENVDWYHQNRSMEMVHGANSDDQAWYKAEDVYEVLERMPSVQPETDLQSTCNEVATDCVSRQAVLDALEGEITVTGWKNAVAVKEYVNLALDRIKRLPSVQPELYKDEVSRQAVKHLDLFTKAYCRDKSVTNDLAFRCEQCDFEMPNGKCLVKTMARKLCPDYKNFGCMGDL